MLKNFLSFFIWLEHHKIFTLAVLFLFRLFYGLSYRFWDVDELQIYLIGLKFYTTKAWPFLGPDIIYTNTQIPGALQGLLVGLPFFLLPVPEAPFILLNILSFFALCFLASYICKRLSDLPRWLVWGGILLNPWTFNVSTYIVNPSYVLFGAILFFIAFLEAIPGLTLSFLSYRVSFFLMGFATFWIMQLHLSWVILPFFTFFVFFSHGSIKLTNHVKLELKQVAKINSKQVKEKSIKLFSLLGYYLLGCLVMSSTLIPTYTYYGFNNLTQSTGENIVFQLENYQNFFVILVRYLSFGCYEIVRFLDIFSLDRLYFFKEAWWAVPFTAFLVFLGALQVIVILMISFHSFFPFKNSKDVSSDNNVKHKELEWIVLRNIVYGAFLFLFFSFFFSVKGPSSHTFYLLFPLVNIFAMYSWGRCSKAWVYPLAALSFICVIVFYLASISLTLPKNSLYSNLPGTERMARDVVVEAMQKKDHRILGLRRYETRRHGIGTRKHEIRRRKTK